MGSGSKGPQLSPDGFIWVQVAWTKDFAGLDSGRLWGWGGWFERLSGLDIMFMLLIPGNRNEDIHYFREGIQEFSQDEEFDYSMPCL